MWEVSVFHALVTAVVVLLALTALRPTRRRYTSEDSFTLLCEYRGLYEVYSQCSHRYVIIRVTDYTSTLIVLLCTVPFFFLNRKNETETEHFSVGLSVSLSVKPAKQTIIKKIQCAFVDIM